MNTPILNQALALSVQERVELVDKLLESLVLSNEDVNNIWAAEAEDRVHMYEQGKIAARPVSETLKKYR